MNIEYLKLADGKTAVTDETGKINVINDELNGEELIAQNKLDIINEEIKKTKKKISIYKELVSLSKFMIAVEAVIAIGGIALGVLIGSKYGGLIFLVGALSVCIPTIAVFGITYPIAKRKLNGYNGKLKKAEELKKKQTKIISKEHKAIATKETIINKPISLRTQNEIELPLVKTQLDAAFAQASSAKTKKLVRKNK